MSDAAPAVPDYLLPDLAWLRGRPEPGAAGAVSARLPELARAAAAELRLDPPEPGSARAARLELAAWRCWHHHWKCPAARPLAGDEVLRSIRAGRGYEGGRKLGGDVVREAVLAAAAAAGELAAGARLAADYGPAVRRECARLGGDPHWWDDFFALLVGAAPRADGAGLRRAKLASYAGKCGLGRWLGTAAAQFLLDRRPKRGAVPLDDAPPVGARVAHPVDALLAPECVERLTAELRVALADLDPRWRALLALTVVDRRTKADAAAVLGVNPGTATRWEQQAVALLQRRLGWSGAAGAAARDCLDALAAAGRGADLSHSLYDSLLPARPEGASP